MWSEHGRDAEAEPEEPEPEGRGQNQMQSICTAQDRAGGRMGVCGQTCCKPVEVCVKPKRE